jgi:hypothetical protein
MEIKTKAIGLRSLPKQQVVITFVGVLLAMFLGSLDQTRHYAIWQHQVGGQA